MGFGPSVTTIVSTDVTAATLVPLSVSSAQNQIAANNLLAGITSTTTLPSGAVIPNTLIVQQPGGTPGTDQINISHDGTNGTVETKDGFLRFVTPGGVATGIIHFCDNAGNIRASIDNAAGAYTTVLNVSCGGGGLGTSINGNGLDLLPDGSVFWRSSASAPYDTGISREDVAAVKITDGSTGLGSLRASTLIAQEDGGTPGTDEASIYYDAVYKSVFTSGGLPAFRFQFGYMHIGPAQLSGGTDVIGGADVGFTRSSPGVWKVTDAVSGTGWIQGRDTRVTADIPNATATMANITGLVETLTAGDKYGFELTIKCNNSTAAEGIAFDFDTGTGTATATSFAAQAFVTVGGTTVLGVQTSTALATDLTFTTITGETWVTIKGCIEVNAGGAFQPRFSEVSHAAGTATVSKNSTMRVWRTAN